MRRSGSLSAVIHSGQQEEMSWIHGSLQMFLRRLQSCCCCSLSCLRAERLCLTPPAHAGARPAERHINTL